jgi:EAL domain-containing protein (putative c-di-GMP-specific phosphodiesterase class I)
VQLKQPDFARRVAGFLSEARLEPQYLDLEITESVLIDSFEDSLPVLEELNELGVRLSLDDFGTGYSSLSYLKRLPIRTVKIDKSFVQDLANNRIQTELAEAIIALAHKIGLGVVAEGVEREEQGEWLKKRGCDCLQGYWFARPMGEEQLRQYMSEQPSAVLASPERPSAERFA